MPGNLYAQRIKSLPQENIFLCAYLRLLQEAQNKGFMAGWTSTP
jgi:hypothetical protein